MDKSEITYLYHKGFTIDEIRKLDTGLDKLTDENSSESVEGKEVIPEVHEQKEEPKEEKKNSDSSEIDVLKKQIENLTNMMQDKNRLGVDNPTPPKEKTIEEIAQEFFNE